MGNFDHVIEETYNKCYLPFLGALADHPQIRLSLHYSGALLEWIDARHPDYLSKLRDLVGRSQVELVGGGYYEPILPGIPDRDKAAQLRRLREFIQSRFGVAPRGAWLAERVWEPSLVRCLVEAGAEYIVLDDTHFLAAGLHSSDLGGYYMTDDASLPLRLVPGLKTLRYTVPFCDPSETINTLRQGLSGSGAAACPAPLFASGDDCEKFGGWPGTFKHCYEDRWLERFFQALEQARDWLSMTTLSEYLDAQPPLGRIYLPTASYEEMMVWALPPELPASSKRVSPKPAGFRAASGFAASCAAESGGIFWPSTRRRIKSTSSWSTLVTGSKRRALQALAWSSAHCWPRLRLIFSPRSAMTLIGTASSADSTHRTCAREFFGA